MKKIISIVLLSLLVVLVASACGAKTEEVKTDETTKANDVSEPQAVKDMRYVIKEFNVVLNKIDTGFYAEEAAKVPEKEKTNSTDPKRDEFVLLGIDLYKVLIAPYPEATDKPSDYYGALFDEFNKLPEMTKLDKKEPFDDKNGPTAQEDIASLKVLRMLG